MGSWGCNAAVVGVMMMAALFVCAHSLSLRPVDPEHGRICGPVCKIYCRYGNVLDNRGCPTCKCRTRPSCLRSWCLRVLKCPNGYAKVNGCPVCRCKPTKCNELLTCRRFCPFGYVLDDNGCSLCKCKRRFPFQLARKTA